MLPSDSFQLGPASEIPQGTQKVYTVKGKRIAVYNVQGEFYATEDICSHDGGPLAEGTLEAFEIECPRHGARFDVRTGQPQCMPALTSIRSYIVWVEDEIIYIKMEESH